MTPPRGSTPRTHRLAEEAALERGDHGFGEWSRLWGAFQPDEEDSPILQTARGFAFVYGHLTPVIRDDEWIVGALLRDASQPSWSWIPGASPDQVASFAKNTPPDRPDLRAMADRGLLSPQGSLNHKVVDYAGYIRTGSLELARRARDKAEKMTGPQRDFALAFALGHDAILQNARRYRDACLEKSRSTTPERAAELLEIARICDKVPAQPAETFHEALQSLWFGYRVAADATGRIDVFLNDFYETDLAAGRITPERALELIECFLIKLHADVMEGFVNVSSVQTLTLGGLLPNGQDGTNALTRLFLKAIRSVRLLRPTVYVRCHPDTPGDVLDLSVSCLAEGLAEPNFYGDRPIIQGLTRIGVSAEAARDYALSGCTEIVSPGLGNWGAPNGWINLALLVDDTLREAAHLAVDSEEKLWRLLDERIEALADACRDCNEWVDARDKDPRYTSTLMMPICLDRCMDIAHGGAATHYGHWEGMGLPNAADMLFTAQEIGFKRKTPLSSLFQRLDQGDSALFREIHRLPKFGNDHPGVDGWAARLIDRVSQALEKRSTSRRQALVLGHLAGGENMHICYGQLMGPTLDGRQAGETLADSLAGSQGKALAGPTAVIQSLCRLDHSRMVAGNVSTLRLTPNDFQTPEARQNVVALIRSFVALGGSQLQINLIDPEVLRDAQAHPERYAGLLVRVAGYSADFTRIGKSLQDEIIQRTARGG